MILFDSAGEAGNTNTFDTLNILSHLTGMPHADDTLLQAVPVCAPYAVLRDYKYKYVYGGVKMMILNRIIDDEMVLLQLEQQTP